MLIYPAIDMYEQKAVRLYKGDYAQMTVYSENPCAVAQAFKDSGATHIHLVDLEGAKAGTTPNFGLVKAIKAETGLFCEIGGGIRDMDTIKKYVDAGIAVKAYGDKIAVGIDIKDGYVAIKGWTETSGEKAMDFTAKMQAIGVRTMICTDISRDGAMKGANHALYRELSERFDMNIIASGGVSSMEDVEKLADLDIHGAIVGKAYYTGAIDLAKAIEVAK